jgi:hypothetical protein
LTLFSLKTWVQGIKTSFFLAQMGKNCCKGKTTQDGKEDLGVHPSLTSTTTKVTSSCYLDQVIDNNT